MNILNLPIVQVLLSIVISWALFSIFISLIQESIAQIMAERGRFMKHYLLKQLLDSSNNINWGSLLYLHGAVDLLTRETNKPTNNINPNTFAEVLIEVVGNAHVVQASLQPTAYKNRTLNNFKSAVLTLKKSDVTSFLALAMNNAEIKANHSDTSINESQVYEELCLQVGGWYKEFLERINLWYKKRIRRKLFLIGLVLSVIINVDSVQLFNFYRVNPQSSTAVINYYQNYIADSTTAHPAIEDDFRKTTASLDSLVKVADLPIGFDYSLFKTHPAKANWLWWKIMGFLLSAFAVSFGAPFWFDVLKKAYSKNIKI